MKTATKKIKYPYITESAEISHGSPIIEGTRITVRCIAGYYQLGMSIDEIQLSLSHLTHSQILSALAYYFDHQREIDSEIQHTNDTQLWKNKVSS